MCRELAIMSLCGGDYDSREAKSESRWAKETKTFVYFPED